ncbi:GNAT family N-acetyltransferase [Paenibacillus alkaliterrae]|uniref:GNAT family N-acetyltransferase n=1 Tax=Paenibacillus alkaliterrae TaxID=320909 RepID=UPI001F301A0D|nr:GNAT family N-acetyltransferase [Paenibacillus alkaliterrae]MCF2939423.1 GNAT family N-acetyltransferase [Paenibacillus alkaliterrae]
MMPTLKVAPEELTFVPLDKVSIEHVQGFSCGNRLIDNYFFTTYKARYDHQNGLAATTVIIYEEKAVGFFTAACTQVQISKEEASSLGISTFLVPAIEVKFLAVEERFQDKGIGTLAINKIIYDVYQFSQIFACRYLFLWSVPDERALSFYQNRYFEDTGTVNSENLHLMMFQIPDDADIEEY